MRKMLLSLLFSISFCLCSITVFAKDTFVQPTEAPQYQVQNENTVEVERYSSGRGSYRAPARAGTGASPGYRTGPRAPSGAVTRPTQPTAGQPATAPTGWGRFLGGMAAGALVGHLLNPFGGSGYGGGGISIFSVLFWILIIFIGYKLYQKIRRGTH